MSELVNNHVQIYQFPTSDETISEVNKNMNALLPFAVVGSNEFVKVGNKMVRARQYPWGVVQGKTETEMKLKYVLVCVNNHCYFPQLRMKIIATSRSSEKC